jgi:alkylation response protein AidB-like acyl-CoA dehydrogenase
LSVDLAFDDAQQAIHDAVARFCAERGAEPAHPEFSLASWRELAGLGVLALTTPEGEGGAAECVAALEALGAAAFPGPLAESFLATAVLPEAERRRVADGEVIVCVGTPPLMPFAPQAQLFLAVEGERLWRATPTGEVEPVETLGGEPWGRVALERQAELSPCPAAFALFDLAEAALLAAHGAALLDGATEHARTRRQFGRAIGEFQAVAHPLADASIRLAAARTLARAAACAFDSASATRDTRRLAAAARASARGAALESAHVAHQTFGALGITVEGPAFRISRRIRQRAAQPTGAAARAACDALLGPLGW